MNAAGLAMRAGATAGALCTVDHLAVPRDSLHNGHGRARAGYAGHGC